jgi:hypothetical protein
MPLRWPRLAVGKPFHVDIANGSDATRLRLAGDCNAAAVGEASRAFRHALASGGAVRLEFAEDAIPDSRFLGLIQMFDRDLRLNNRQLEIYAHGDTARNHFQLYGAEYMLSKVELIKEVASKKSM